MHGMTRLRAATTAVVLAAGMWWLGSVGDASVGKNGEVGGLTAKFVDVNGVRTRYYDYGQGEALVLVHGGGFGCCSSANNWGKNIPSLSKRFRVVAMDGLAAGLTENPKDDADYSYEGRAKHVYQFIQTLKLGPVHLVGHSAGGAVVFYLAMEHPEIVKTLTVVAHGPGMPPAGEGPTKLQPALDACPQDTSTPEHMMCRHKALAYSAETFGAEDLEASAFLMTSPKWDETRRRLAAIAAKQPQDQRPQPDTYRQRMWDKQRSAGTLQMPIMIYVGMQDVLSWVLAEPHSFIRGELGFFDIVGAKNPRVKLVVVNEAGHFPYRDQPAQFDADLIDFIDFSRNQPAASTHTGR